MRSKKEIKQAYKERKFKIGVFQIKNKVNGKIFIGSSLDLEAIWNRIQMELKFGSHRNKALQNDWRKYGAENFQFEILAELKQDDKKKINYQKEVKDLEKLYLDELQPFEPQGYNRKPAQS